MTYTTTRSLKTTDTRHRYVDAAGNVCKWNSTDLPKTQLLTIELEGDVTLSIDVEALIKSLGYKALRAKTHKAVEASGAVVVTAKITSSKAGEWANR